MATQVGVGFSDVQDSRTAGAEAASVALAKAGIAGPVTGRASFALLFSTGRHDPRKLRDGVREVLGPTCRVYGGFGVGIITHDHLSYDGYEVGLALFASDTLKLDALLELQLAGNEASVGARLGARLARNLREDSNLILLYDSVKPTPAGPRLNMATPLLKAMSAHLDAWPNLAGMGTIGDMQLQPTFQWYDQQVVEQSAMALHFTGCRMDTIIMHGCKPAGRYYQITKTDGPVVLEIDNRPALQVVHEMLGPDSGLTHEDYSFFITLGVNKGDRYGTFREDDYANRMCIGVDEGRQGLIMFEDDLTPGMHVQLMRRAMDFSYIGPRTNELLKRALGTGESGMGTSSSHAGGARRALFAFYIDCAGRAGAYCGMDAEDAVEVQKALPKEIPLLGVYSGVEIAKVGGQPQALDWTGVLCLFSE